MIAAITNQKGGVGKTTLAINLSAALSLLGYRVLVIDLDPQGNCSDGLGIDTNSGIYTIYDVLINKTPLSEVIIKHPYPNLFIAPANMSLFGAEAELSTEISRPFKLRQALKDEKLKYDFILIDCPPNLGVLTVNAILASTDIISPIEPNSYALKGMSVLINTLLKMQTDLKHYVNFLGIVINRFDTKNTLHKSILDGIHKLLPADKIFQTKLERNSLISEAEIHGQSVLEYEPSTKAANMFTNLANELITKNNERRKERKAETLR